jgi:D-serine dehydratase
MLKGNIMDDVIAGRTPAEWKRELPLLASVLDAAEVFWINPRLTGVRNRRIAPDLSLADIRDAEARLERFAPYLARVFPETEKTGGIIESEVRRITSMQARLTAREGLRLPGALYLKCDSHLPISGSVKARGGIYEVLQVAEDIARDNGLLPPEGDSYAPFSEERFRRLFSRYSIVVGSTGNLGLSIGIMSAKLGFRVVVHMSADARQWKKDMLRAKGAIVIEHAGDYGQAVASGRKESEADPKSHFVDDENSRTLFLGYAVAALRLSRQLDAAGIVVDAGHPLFVYLPCGVGGAPGGITFGLRMVFGDAVRCFFAEPTLAPAMLLGLMTEKHNEVSAREFGIEGTTEADGLAVGRPSGFVGRTLLRDVSGVFTVRDDNLFRLLAALADSEGIFLEPSATAGFPGPARLVSTAEGQSFLAEQNLSAHMDRSTHLVWATGGGMVPREIMEDFYARGKALSQE